MKFLCSKRILDVFCIPLPIVTFVILNVNIEGVFLFLCWRMQPCSTEVDANFYEVSQILAHIVSFSRCECTPFMYIDRNVLIVGCPILILALFQA